MDGIANTFTGTHFEVGQQIGAYYARQNVRFPALAEAELLRRQLQFYDNAAPEIVDELRGIASGSNSPFDVVAHKFLVEEILYFRERQRSCSIGGFTDNTGRLWVARNYDWNPAVAENFQAWKFQFPETSVVAISDMDISDSSGVDKSKQAFFHHDAINSHGLFIGLTYAFCWTNEVGLLTADAVRLVSWRCKTVDEALDLFSDIKLACSKNFFIADSAGNMAVVEHVVTDSQFRRPHPDNGILVLTNNYNGRLEQRDEVLNVNPNHTTFKRYSRLERDLDSLRQSGQEITFAQLDKIMTDPATPVCQFLPHIGVETVWTLLLEPIARNYQLIGNPRSPQRVVADFRF